MATVDFLTPIVDDPAAWGAIAAANALSDVYAMGGTPLFALNLVGWPRDKLPLEMLADVLKGGAETAARAGCLIVGGHSIDDAEPKYGMAVIGEVHPDRMLTNAGGCAGDALVLTKPLGTGILATALKRDALLEAGMAEAVRSMTTLNAAAAQAALRVGVSAATDVTGFGLLGHLLRICDASKVGAEIAYDTLPILAHARNLAARGFIPGRHPPESRGDGGAGHLGRRSQRNRPLARGGRADLGWPPAGGTAGERGGAPRRAARRRSDRRRDDRAAGAASRSGRCA